MSNFSLSRNERLYLTKESTYGTPSPPAIPTIAATSRLRCRIPSRCSTGATRPELAASSKAPAVVRRPNGRPRCRSSPPAKAASHPTATCSSTCSSARLRAAYLDSRRHHRVRKSVELSDALDARPARRPGAVLQRATFTLGADIAEWTAEGRHCMSWVPISLPPPTQSRKAVWGPSGRAGSLFRRRYHRRIHGAITVDGVTLAEIRTPTSKSTQECAD